MLKIFVYSLSWQKSYYTKCFGTNVYNHEFFWIYGRHFEISYFWHSFTVIHRLSFLQGEIVLPWSCGFDRINLTVWHNLAKNHHLCTNIEHWLYSKSLCQIKRFCLPLILHTYKCLIQRHQLIHLLFPCWQYVILLANKWLLMSFN